MPVNYEPDSEWFISDLDTIKRWALTEADRRAALKKAMNRPWASADIGCLERFENGTRWGWAMYTHRKAVKGPPKA